jgi:putative oxidoreductase
MEDSGAVAARFEPRSAARVADFVLFSLAHLQTAVQNMGAVGQWGAMDSALVPAVGNQAGSGPMPNDSTGDPAHGPKPVTCPDNRKSNTVNTGWTFSRRGNAFTSKGGPHMLAYLRKPHNDLAALALRLGLAAIFVWHGYIKISLDWGGNWNDTFTEATQYAVAWGELLVGLALLLGLLTRLAALGGIVIQAGAIYFVTHEDFTRETFRRSGLDLRAIGFEYNFLIIVACLAVILLGAGFASADHCLMGRKKVE